MNYIEVEAGVGVLLTWTLRDRDVEKEATGKYSCRVLVSNTATAAPLHCQRSETSGTYLCRVLPGNTAAPAPLHCQHETSGSALGLFRLITFVALF